MNVLFVNAADSTRHVSSANASIYPNLGLLMLMSSLKKTGFNRDIELSYIDGALHGNDVIQKYIKETHDEISIICFSVLTANYGVSLKLARYAQGLNPKIVTIFGNDHFSALYENIMLRRSEVSYGFYGNDVVEGFTQFVSDILSDEVVSLNVYYGLVYRDSTGRIRKNSENPAEYNRLPLVEYSLADSLFPHNDKYLEGQKSIYQFMDDRDLNSQVMDIGRGCIKFSGPRENGVPKNACDFCGIIPGEKVILTKSVKKAWEILQNAFDQGYDYFYITADELPLTLWELLKGMSDSIPAWYENLSINQRPKMFGYARAEGFNTCPDKIDILVDILGFDQFFIGFDGLSEISLNVMNKKPVGNKAYDLMNLNMEALQKVVKKGCLITAGLVVTHLGITREIMEENYRVLEKIITDNPSIFAALDFGPLCPIPGSLTFEYLVNPELAQMKAEQFGLSVDVEYLESVRHKYVDQDFFNMDELIKDFNKGCCPAITDVDVEEHLKQIRSLAEKHSIVIGGGV